MPRFRIALIAFCLILGDASSRTASASCEHSPTFLEKAQWACATVLAVVVERTGVELSPPLGSGFGGVTVRVSRVRRGSHPDRRLTIWGGGGFHGPPRGFTVGSTWAVFLYGMDPGFPPPVRYGFGSECSGQVAIPLSPDDTSGKYVREALDRATSESVPRLRSECLSGTSDSCYALACAEEQGLGVRRDPSSALALYRRAYEISAGIEE